MEYLNNIEGLELITESVFRYTDGSSLRYILAALLYFLLYLFVVFLLINIYTESRKKLNIPIITVGVAVGVIAVMLVSKTNDKGCCYFTSILNDSPKDIKIYEVQIDENTSIYDTTEKIKEKYIFIKEYNERRFLITSKENEVEAKRIKDKLGK